MTDIIDTNEDKKYKTLLESTRAIPWKLNWETKQFSYIGPQIEKLLGWTQASWLNAGDWIDRIHPDDRERTANFCISQSEDGVDHEADYRALKADGSFVWVRDVVHIIREEGITKELVGFIFDISERKKMEDELIFLNKKLEVFSYQDGLTKVPNRRLFDQTLNVEWTRAQRSQQPISLLILDIDNFKQYNDLYGHLQGDDCLTRIANTLSKVTARSSDMFARYGGEEFVLLLPDTNSKSAIKLAEKCRSMVLEQNIKHEASSVSDVVTISVGVSTINPTVDAVPSSLIVAADKMLYQAKKYNRNRVEFC